MINKTLAILAGGKSSRMNYNNKALLTLKEKTFIEHIIEAGSDYKEIIIVANDEEAYKPFKLRIIKDIISGKGPLSGIHSALKNSTTEDVLCIACDMPLISKETLNTLGNINDNYDVLVPKIQKRLQPLCAIYSKKLIKEIEGSLIRNENKLQMLINSIENKIVYKKLEDRDFTNINTPEEYKELEEI